MKTPPDLPDLPDLPDDVAALLNAERELSTEEREKLRNLGDATWWRFYQTVTRRARSVYSTATPAQFAVCVSEHMSQQNRDALIGSETYTCPSCHQLLKDRRAPVATAILVERQRLQELWHDIENADDAERPSAIERFRQALHP